MNQETLWFGCQISRRLSKRQWVKNKNRFFPSKILLYDKVLIAYIYNDILQTSYLLAIGGEIDIETIVTINMPTKLVKLLKINTIVTKKSQVFENLGFESTIYVYVLVV